MDKDRVLKALKELKENSKKRNFSQSVDLVITLKGLILKNVDHQLDFFVNLHKDRGVKQKICALVGPESAEEAKKVCDFTITQDDFGKYQRNKKALKKIAKTYDFFIAQANIMPKVAQIFGRVLGPKGKMPNPKAGAVFPAKASLQPLYDRLQKTIRIMSKKQPVVHVMVGKENIPDDDIVDNVLLVYNQIVHHLPAEKNNIKGVYLKHTMSKPVKVE